MKNQYLFVSIIKIIIVVFAICVFTSEETSSAVNNNTNIPKIDLSKPTCSKHVPDVESAKLDKVFKIGEYFALLFTDIKSNSEIKYEFIMAVIEPGKSEVCYHVSSECVGFLIEIYEKMKLGRSLCDFNNGNTSHANYGHSENWMDKEKFTSKALEMIVKYFNINSRPVEIKNEINSYPLEFNLLSIDIKRSHQYDLKKLSTSEDYRILIAKIVIKNNSDIEQHFSSQQFSIIEGNGEEIDSDFYGVGDNIAESGNIITIDSKKNNPDGLQIYNYKGKLSGSVSFIEWNLSAGQRYEDTLVFIIPAGNENISLQFSK